MKGAKFNNTITRKVLMVIGACLVITLTLFILFIEYQSYQFQLSQLIHQQSRITEGQSILLSDQLAENEEDAVFYTLSGIVANPAIVGVELDYRDSVEGMIIGDTSAPLTYSESISYMDDKLNIVEVAEITTYATTLHIDVALRQRVIYLLGLIATLLLCILGITALVLKKIIGNPLALIVSTIEKSDIDETPPIIWQSNDEIGQVVDRLNTLHNKQRQKLVGLRQELSESEVRESERLRNLANASFESIIIYVDNSIVDVNDRMANLFDMEKQEFLTKKLDDMFHGEFLDALNRNLDARENYFGTTQLAISNGEVLPIEFYVSDFSYGDIKARVAVLRDITDRLEAEKNIRFLAHHDGLTKLLNRTAFIAEFQESVKQAEECGLMLAVLYLDLDNFKEVNDIYGHAAGDALLRNVANRMAECVPKDTTVARLGGDEFVITSTGESWLDINPTQLAIDLLESVNACKSEEHVGNGFGASIGISVYNGVGTVQEDLLAQADMALYHAKKSGRNTYKLYSSELGSEHKKHRLLADRLTMAISRDELILHYQPQVSVSSGELIGFEALIRWNDAILGQVPPQDIVETAQREHLSDRLSEWVLREVCKEASNWPRYYTVSVNLTPTDLANKDLPAFINTLLSEAYFPAERLDIEITESAIINDVSHADELIKKLQNMGITVALDDFGTGYSSLSFLQNLSFDRIKLDKSFVNTSDPDSLKIAKAIIELGKELNVDVLAEGVETVEQMNRMREQGCTMVQGYYVSEPLPSQQLQAYMQAFVLEARKVS